MVGVPRFELGASWSQTKRSNLAELHPGTVYRIHAYRAASGHRSQGAGSAWL